MFLSYFMYVCYVMYKVVLCMYVRTVCMYSRMHVTYACVLCMECVHACYVTLCVLRYVCFSLCYVCGLSVCVCLDDWIVYVCMQVRCWLMYVCDGSPLCM